MVPRAEVGRGMDPGGETGSRSSGQGWKIRKRKWGGRVKKRKTNSLFVQVTFL